ncbi:7393_t:CDS:2, partial [Dentiscutata heterogama]
SAPTKLPVTLTENKALRIISTIVKIILLRHVYVVEMIGP